MTAIPADALDRINQAICQLQSLKGSWPYTPPECLSGLYWQRIFAVVTLLDPKGDLVSKPVANSSLEEGRTCEYHGSLVDHWGPGIAMYDETNDCYVVDVPGDQLIGVHRESITFTDEHAVVNCPSCHPCEECLRVLGRCGCPDCKPCLTCTRLMEPSTE